MRYLVILLVAAAAVAGYFSRELAASKAAYKGPGADSEEKHEPASDVDTAERRSESTYNCYWLIDGLQDVGQLW